MDNGSVNGERMNGVDVDVTDYFNLDDDSVEIHFKTHTKKVKAFSDHRRKLKPNRNHTASLNPLKVLIHRQDVKDDYDITIDEDNNNGSDVADRSISIKAHQNRNKAEIKKQVNGSIEKNIKNSVPKNGHKLVGRASSLGVGKVKEREFKLADDAKKGLESKEDIHSASQSLRVTEKDKRTGVGTEKTNIHDGVKGVMLFLIKGARHIQTRLVEPKSSSMNSGDVFVLVTPKYVFQWNGKNCSIMEKARGAEITAVIQQWKELGCNAEAVHVIDEGHEKSGSHFSTFWKFLGDKKQVREIDDVFEDKEFEKGILESNIFYEIKSKDSDDEDAECWLERIEKFSGCVPSKKWLECDKAYVLDFGTEVYSWIGRKASGAPRRKAADIGLELYNKGYQSQTLVHPYNINNKSFLSSELMPRPEWSVYGRMAEKTESVAFRRKFFDWPDPVDLKVKTVEAKVHSQLTKDYTNDPSLVMNPIPVQYLTQPIQEPLMVLDGSFIGRGRGMKDMETLFQYGVTLNNLTIWQISGNLFDEMPLERHGIFYSGEAYVLKWNFEIFRTGINRLKGGKSKQEDAGKNRIVFFFWQGKDCTSSERGQAALRTIELNTEEGPQILVSQGKEPPSFFQLFDGKMIVHGGKMSDDVDFSKKRMYWVRNEVEVETCLVEVPATSSSLRSRSSFVLADVQKSKLYIWHGVKSMRRTQERALSGAKNLKEKTDELHNKKLKIHEIMEGDEIDEFWDCFGDDEDYISYLELKKDFQFTPRCFSFDNLHGYFRHVEISSSAYHPDYICPFPILQSDLYELSQPALVFIDAQYKIYLWEGWWPKGEDDGVEKAPSTTAAEKHRFNMNRKVALQSLKAYAEDVERSLSRAYIVSAGCEPLEFTNLFPHWVVDDELTKAQLDNGKTYGEQLNFLDVLQQLEKTEYTLSELKQTQLPEGVDPTQIEQYLGNEEFMRTFKVNKEGFKKLPRWKQIELKKGVGLF